MEEKKFSFNEKSIYYRVTGQGPEVVLLHGFGEDGSIWEDQWSIEGFRFIIPDLPGSGKSDAIDDMSMEGMAEAIKSLVVHETATLYFKEGEPGSVILVGHSMGGYITLAFAEKYHQMLRGFGLFHSSAFADSEEKKETRKKGIEFIREHGAFAFLKTSIPDLYSEKSKQEQPHLLEKHLKSVHNFSDAALVSYYESMMKRPDRTHILKQTHLPVLFILGTDDKAVPLEDGLRQCHLPDISYIHVLESAGHMGMAEQATESNKILTEYLRAVR